jgi:hypothetical protein
MRYCGWLHPFDVVHLIDRITFLVVRILDPFNVKVFQVNELVMVGYGL